MANSYTTVTDVAAELGGASITSSTTPSSSTVSGWIEEESKFIEIMTGRVWTSNSVSSTDWEYHDYDGSGIINLDNFPIISIEVAQYTANGLGDSSTNWSTLSEGRTSDKDFIVYKKEGVLKLHPRVTATNPAVSYETIRVAYTHGYATTPPHIKRLTTLLAAKRYILANANSSASEEGGSVSVGTIRVSDPNNYVHTHIDRINKEIDSLTKEVTQSTKFHIYESQLY